MNATRNGRSATAVATAGIFWATVTYVLWGITPLYWKLLQEFPAEELVAHRVIWSALCLLPIYLFPTKRAELRNAFRNVRRGIFLVVISAALIGYNWYIYVLAVTSHRVLDSSLGYFMTPLMSVMVGVLLLHERLTRLQVVAVTLAFLGVVFFAIELGRLPSLALLLSSTFAFYGYCKKKVEASGTLTVSLETLLLSPFAIGLLWSRGVGVHPPTTWILLLLSGPLTAIPMIWYTWAVKDIPFTVVGFLQYLSPVLMFILAIYFYQEPFGLAQKAIFVLIWIALFLFSMDIYRRFNDAPILRRDAEKL